MRKIQAFSRSWGVTLLELMVVVLIISILASIATGVYTGETYRARVAAAHALVHNLEVAITRYEIDTGSLPPSGSGTDVPPAAMAASTTDRVNGSGYLHLALMHSVSGNLNQPASTSWKGPYINLQAGQASKAQAGMRNILDPWGSPILYFAWPDYAVTSSNFTGGTQMFGSTAPAGASVDLPAPNPFVATETYYNPRTFQLISPGPDGTSLSGSTGASYLGAASDDINNFGY